ncbi:MAG TPA: FAD/NAD(P)-binding oxidoreductase [Acidimicrobiales bacterium]
MKILILGAGFGGLELATALSDEFGDEHEVTLIDKGEGFVFGFSKLDVMFGKATPSGVFHPYRDIDKPGVTFVRATIGSIDPVGRRVETDAGPFEADILVVALGADLDPGATPGLVEGGSEFYTVAGAFALRDELAAFPGGRVVVGVTSTPFKCPPAPSEAALLMHDYLSARGLRTASTISLVMPFGIPIPPSPDASSALLDAFAERDIEWVPDRMVTGLDAEANVVLCGDGSEVPYDLFLGVPVHRAPSVVTDSALAVDGWIPVDPLTLETSFPDVYAVGDVTSVGTPKAGVFAEGQAAVAARQIIARLRGDGSSDTYDGEGICYLEFGHDRVGKVTVTFLSGQAPTGGMEGPSEAIATDKKVFGTTRIQRWFDRPWVLD